MKLFRTVSICLTAYVELLHSFAFYINSFFLRRLQMISTFPIPPVLEGI